MVNEDRMKDFQDDLTLSSDEMEDFVKQNIKSHYISEKPKRQQLYFLYKIILNRQSFVYHFSDWIMFCLCRIRSFCSCNRQLQQTDGKKGITCRKACSYNQKLAERKHRTFRRGKEKLTRDLDIVKLIQL